MNKKLLVQTLSNGQEIIITRPPILTKEEKAEVDKYDLNSIPKPVKKQIVYEFLQNAYDNHGIYLAKIDPAKYINHIKIEDMSEDK